jgi:hypothetical protein
MLPPENKRKGFKEFDALNFGYTSGASFFICCGVGFWADQKWGTGFRYTLIGLFTGLGVIGFELWKIIQNLNDTNDKKK